MDLLSLLHRLSPRERRLLTAVLVCIVAVGGYMLLIDPQVNEVKVLERSLANAQKRLSLRQNQVEEVTELEQSQQNLLATFTSLHRRMFSPAQLHPLLKDLALDVKRSGCELRSILPRTDSTTDRAGSIVTVESIEIRLRGDYTAILETLRRMELRPQFVSVDEMMIETTGGAGILQALLTLHVYSFNEESHASAG